MKKVFIVLLFFFFVIQPVYARSGCCSHHSGVRSDGCGCNDGTPLSSTCAPYYSCSQPPTFSTYITLPKVVPTIKPTLPPTLIPTIIPTKKPTNAPMRKSTVRPTSYATSRYLPTKNSHTQEVKSASQSAINTSSQSQSIKKIQEANRKLSKKISFFDWLILIFFHSKN